MKCENKARINKYVGDIFPTKYYGNVVLVEYKNYRNVKIKFLNTSFEKWARMDHLLKGSVKDTTVFGEVLSFGVNDFPECCKYVRNRWNHVMRRCYSVKFKEEYASYVRCTSSENFRSLRYFSSWWDIQVGSSNKDWQLDKDILVKGNKLYSEDTCVFVPREINNLFNKPNNSTKLIGTSLCKRSNKFRAILKNKHIGLFQTEVEAFYAYKEAKEAYIKEVAEKWKGQIDPRVYNALMNYQVEITD